MVPAPVTYALRDHAADHLITPVIDNHLDTAVDDTGFIVDAVGPNGLAAVFEDDGDTGYLYLYEPDGRGILRDVHIYNRSAAVQPTSEDIQCRWTVDQTRCGVFVWDVLRAAIDVVSGDAVRAVVHDRSSGGVVDSAWLSGFVPA